ncbi:pantothenate kinase [Thermosipho atlanticus DSM 15807]|uniref:Type III pantothenate kinase n=1 Tax=Thermosipho atlanticus DSM 15807 TaxID=1123380 RepID=A0A1M5QZA3_9BACT|nr:pantothenate kinase [Thermosipho atlanticus DSM 15807]
MLFDVGNTHTTVAITDDGKNFDIRRISTKLLQTEDELFVFLRGFYDVKVKQVVVSSVVPNINHVLSFFAQKYVGCEAVFVEAIKFSRIKWNVKIPEEIGADRVADVIAAYYDYGKDAIVVDFGTAITIEVLKNGIYEGGVIIPGFSMLINALFEGTAKLPMVEIKAADRFVGKDTESNIRIGTINAIMGGIRYLIDNIKKEQKFKDVPLIFTGGQARLIQNQKIFSEAIIDYNLGLRGIFYFYESLTN